jgi:prevent-host-death family protein
MRYEVSIDDAKNQLSKLIALAEQGQTIVITKNNTPIVRSFSISVPRSDRLTVSMQVIFCLSGGRHFLL